MITLNEARVLQSRREKKAIKKFFGFVVIIAVMFCGIYLYTDLFEISAVFYVITLLILISIAKYCGIDRFFSAKEFIGEVQDVHIYRITERVSKGVGVGHGGSGGTHFEAELLVKNRKGRTIFKTFWNGDVTSHLAVGDEIAILRFVDEPILIKGKYWSSNK